MPDLWTPSDDLLADDPIAAAKVANPHAAPELTEVGVVLPDGDEDFNQAHAAVVLAELDGDDAVCDENGDAPDDDDCMDPDDNEVPEA